MIIVSKLGEHMSLPSISLDTMPTEQTVLLPTNPPEPNKTKKKVELTAKQFFGFIVTGYLLYAVISVSTISTWPALSTDDLNKIRSLFTLFFGVFGSGVFLMGSELVLTCINIKRKHS